MKIDSKNVLKYLKKVGVWTFILAALTTVYLLTNERPVHIDSAEDQIAERKMELKDRIDRSEAELENWLILLSEKEDQLLTDHSDHLDSLTQLRSSFSRIRWEIDSGDSSIRFLEEEANWLIRKFENETENVSFHQSVNID